MADAVGPDPATRTVHGYLPELVKNTNRIDVLEVFLAGARFGGNDPMAAFNSWYSQFLAPSLPVEPRRYPPEPTSEEWAGHALEPDDRPALEAHRDAIQARKGQA